MKIVLTLITVLSFNFAYALTDSWKNADAATKKSQLEAQIFTNTGVTRLEITHNRFCSGSLAVSPGGMAMCSAEAVQQFAQPAGVVGATVSGGDNGTITTTVMQMQQQQLQFGG